MSILDLTRPVYTLIASVNEGNVYFTSSTNAPIKSKTAHSNDIIQHSQTAERVIDIMNANFPNANFPNANFPNANFPDANFSKHSIEKSVNASDKGKNTDQSASYAVYFTSVVTSDIDFSSTSSEVGNSVTVSTNQLSSSRVRKKFVSNAFTSQNISPKIAN